MTVTLPPDPHPPQPTWLRWVIIFAAIWIGVAVVRGITYALSTATGG
jgi:hypothetical protein